MNVFLKAHRDNELKIAAIKLAKSREHIQQLKRSGKICKK